MTRDRDAESRDGYYEGFYDFVEFYLDVQMHAELDYLSPDPWANAETHIRTLQPTEQQLALDDIDELMALPTEQDRRKAFRHELYTIPDDPGAWDAFLAAYRERVLRERAGDRSRPLVDPRGPRKKLPPVSPQGYDVTLASAGSFDNLPVAEAAVEGVLEGYADRLRETFADSRPGVTRRLPPLRCRYDQEVGLVAVRDGDPVRTRTAVVLLHDVGGQSHVFSAYPMEDVPPPPPFDALGVLFGGWLHADWVDDYPDGACDPVEQVRRFAASEPVDVVEQAAYELEVVRGTGTEADRRRAVRGMCSFFLPRPEGQLDAFLAEAAQVIAEVLRRR